MKWARADSLSAGAVSALRNGRRISWVVGLLLLGFVAFAHGQSDESAKSTVLGIVDSKFSDYQHVWFEKIKSAARHLFFSLMLVDFLVSRALKLLDGNETIEALIGGIGKQLLRYTFFYLLLNLADKWLPAIIDTFKQVATNAAGVNSTTPDGVLDTGLDVALAIVKSLSDLGIAEAAMMAVPMMLWALIIYLAFAFVAFQLLIVNIEIYLFLGASVILLGFGGSAWTKDMAVNVYKYAVHVGVKLMMLLLVVSIGQDVFGSQPLIDPNNFIRSAMASGGLAVLYAFLCFKAPAMASSMLSGTSSLSAGDAVGAAVGMAAGAAAVGAGAMGAAGMAAQGGAAATDAVAGATGLAQALGAGFEAAADHGKSGLGAASHALGEVASHGMGVAGAAASGAIERSRDAFDAKVAGSTGARIADSIQASRGGSIGPALSGQAGGDAVDNGAPDGASAGGSADAAAEGDAPGGSGAAAGRDGDAAGSAEAPTGGPQAHAGQSDEGTGLVESLGAGGAAGDATGASLAQGSAPDDAGGAGRPPAESYRRRLHEDISALKGHIPDDSAPAANVSIDTNAHR